MQSTGPSALVVDDDALTRMHACDILEDAGFSSYEACDGEEAISQLERSADHITLLFSDVEMPGMSGFELASHVDERWPWIEIVVASGTVHAQADDLPAKATFIGKPFSAGTVKSHLAEKLPDGKKPELLKRAV